MLKKQNGILADQNLMYLLTFTQYVSLRNYFQYTSVCIGLTTVMFCTSGCLPDAPSAQEILVIMLIGRAPETQPKQMWLGHIFYYQDVAGLGPPYIEDSFVVCLVQATLWCTGYSMMVHIICTNRSPFMRNNIFTDSKTSFPRHP